MSGSYGQDTEGDYHMQEGNVFAEEEDELQGFDMDALMGDKDEDDQTPILFSDGEDEDNNTGGRDDDDAEIAAAFGSDSDVSLDEEDDDEEGAFMDAIRAANNFRVKKRGDKKRPRAKPTRELDPEVMMLLSVANEFFVDGRYDEAEEKFLEVIKLDPRNFSAYKTLGEIYDRQDLKNKACNAWFLAAHLNPADGRNWEFVARVSRDLGHLAQALYCYGRALTAKHKTYDVLYQRALLYREVGQLGRSLENFQKLQKIYPGESDVVRELALIYIQLNRVNDAIAMYLKIYERNVAKRLKDDDNNYLDASDEDEEEEEDSGSEIFPVFNWSMLNILAELFVKQKNHAIAVKTIKQISRWIQRREDEEFWEDVNDDSEFDERRYENFKFEALSDVLKTRSHKLPIDIRVKLGSLRLRLNHTEEALIHFGFLLNEDLEEMADLYSDAGTKLEEVQLFSDAVKFYLPLSRLDEFQIPELFTSLGRCFTELGKYEDAKEYYSFAQELDPENIDIQLALVEVLYYLEEFEESQHLLEAINKKRSVSKKSIHDDADDAVDADADADTDNRSKSPEQDHPFTSINDELALIQNNTLRVPKKGKLTEAEKQERDAKIKRNVLDKYNRLQRLHIGLEEGDPIAATTWIQLASELIELFSNVKNFFSRDRSIKFRGIITRTRRIKMDIESKIERISQLYQGFTSKNEERISITATEEYRGLKYQQWFELFMQYALAVAKYDNPIDASSIVDNAKNINVFYQNKEREEIMNMVKLAVSLKTQDNKEMLLSLRIVLNSFQFHKKVLKLFLLCQPSGKICTENFISINHQKYFLRQIKAYDSLNQNNKSITGMATITNTGAKTEGHDNAYLMYIYACLLFTNRSYVPSLVYFTRIYKSFKNEPIVCLNAGLAHVHRSMQRSSSNRHLELLQGLKFIFEYYELRNSKNFERLEHQEAAYNVARVYHLLGLFSIAVEYYNQVLTSFDDLDIEEDLKRPAAYNLILIYNESGNTRLSNKIMEDYLTI
ncbi:Transcription factor tau subunit [Wickerhamomyces ciferrii]|uniref:Transcription factor tau subunit n=1 Tax=Wickerhamomyces ciferrii (strain ATCC 14091 / BCRC 22168 / CBS 111 / JCM 3599 / NBRC 0793 / NRRL Y-1031 F-60-10) TaxID=1206466 RepID=K0KLE8_WICCF|nr:Transcription factor tau subunit [Wickerhamomyces ciferrii]CCH46085.1 Transcription factor tau subunit [Wickerhamomyces ciferrii]